MMVTKPIPISSAKEIARKYGYSQVIIVARAVGQGGCEHVTTYGIDKANCGVAARIGDYLKYKIMGWQEKPKTSTGFGDAWMMCSHANEVPNICQCGEGCICQKEGACR